jgi:plastocyanin domain-containing protein
MLLAALLALPGCGSGDEAARATLNGSVQTVTTSFDSGRYVPITVQAGVPVQWTIHVPQGKLNGCNNALIIPEYKVETPLREGDTLVEFTPDAPGTYAYTCWMGMIRSSITVVEAL